ncbi:MAG: DUF3710 domain-containing protein [Streptosporangiaceae bacterium]
MFRRRRSADVGRDWASEPEDGQELADDEFADEPADDDWPAQEPRPEGGPWDAGESFPPRERVDLGSLLVPMGPEHEIQLVMADQHGAWVTIRHGESEMQVQAFAASRRGALWDDVRAEITKDVREAGGDSQEIQGSFGTELTAQVPAEPGQPASGMQLVRFVGVDGPRWFLRGLFTGPAAGGGEPAGLLEEVFRDVVVVRGEHPVPPRDILELRLPPEAQKAFEEQAAAAAEENRFQPDLNPFERGPEFTETR